MYLADFLYWLLNYSVLVILFFTFFLPMFNFHPISEMSARSQFFTFFY